MKRRPTSKQLETIQAQLEAAGYDPGRIEIAMERYRQGRYGLARKALRRPICGARRVRDGQPCQARPVPGKKRCRFHGGMSTGPRTAEGRERIAEAQRRRWAEWRRRKLGELLG